MGLGTALLLACALVCALLYAPAVALAQDYDLTFTLPTAGKSGCMVCHADPNLGRLQGDQWVSYYVEGGPLDDGPHSAVMCTGCHLDFAYKSPHEVDPIEWVRTARLACKNCHQEQWTAYSEGIHSISVQPGDEFTELDATKPLCGDCHGPSHEILALTDNPQGQADLHRRGYEICGRCHEDYWDNYYDYYHGAAYQRGATDAPACWDCHGFHDMQPSSDRDSAVHPDNLEETCSQCHDGANEAYVSYAGLVHRRADVYAENPLYSFIKDTRDSIEGFFGTIRSWFT